MWDSGCDAPSSVAGELPLIVSLCGPFGLSSGFASEFLAPELLALLAVLKTAALSANALLTRLANALLTRLASALLTLFDGYLRRSHLLLAR